MPIPDDPLQASLGILKGSGYTFADFMRERQKEREEERRQDEQDVRRVAEAKEPYGDLDE